MTPEQRIAAIRDAVGDDPEETGWEYANKLRNRYASWGGWYANEDAEQAIRWLLAYTAALRAVAEAAEGMPPMVMHGQYVGMCLFCFASAALGREITHTDTCRYGLLQAALQRWREVQG